MTNEVVTISREEYDALMRRDWDLGALEEELETRDGVVAHHGMSVWLPNTPSYDPPPECGTVVFVVDTEGGRAAIKDSYSTPELAEAARLEAERKRT